MPPKPYREQQPLSTINSPSSSGNLSHSNSPSHFDVLRLTSDFFRFWHNNFVLQLQNNAIVTLLISRPKQTKELISKKNVRPQWFTVIRSQYFNLQKFKQLLPHQKSSEKVTISEGSKLTNQICSDAASNVPHAKRILGASMDLRYYYAFSTVSESLLPIPSYISLCL